MSPGATRGRAPDSAPGARGSPRASRRAHEPAGGTPPGPSDGDVTAPSAERAGRSRPALDSEPRARLFLLDRHGGRLLESDGHGQTRGQCRRIAVRRPLWRPMPAPAPMEPPIAAPWRRRGCRPGWRRQSRRRRFWPRSRRRGFALAIDRLSADRQAGPVRQDDGRESHAKPRPIAHACHPLNEGGLAVRPSTGGNRNAVAHAHVAGHERDDFVFDACLLRGHRRFHLEADDGVCRQHQVEIFRLGRFGWAKRLNLRGTGRNRRRCRSFFDRANRFSDGRRSRCRPCGVAPRRRCGGSRCGCGRRGSCGRRRLRSCHVLHHALGLFNLRCCRSGCSPVPTRLPVLRAALRVA